VQNRKHPWVPLGLCVVALGAIAGIAFIPEKSTPLAWVGCTAIFGVVLTATNNDSPGGDGGDSIGSQDQP
jgi:hypothetical protein